MIYVLRRRSTNALLLLAMLLPAGPSHGEDIRSLRVQQGELDVVFRDNSESPRVLSGLQSLFNTKHAPGYDAYDPDAVGASAGLNFEHVISGHRSPNNKFTPRHGRYTLHQLPHHAVKLVRRAEDSPWAVASTLTYQLTSPHYVDFEFRCTPTDAARFGRRRWATFFFANYMNDVAEVPLHFRGVEKAGGTETWVAADAPPGHPDWNQGGNYRSIDAADLEYDDDVEFPLNSWSYEWPRFTRPFYYGKAAHGMTLILMFDRMHSADDQIRFSLYKFKVPRRPRPAWDFQYVIHRVEQDKTYGFRGRLVWKKFVSAEDCLAEYQHWAEGLRKGQGGRAALECFGLKADLRRDINNH